MRHMCHTADTKGRGDDVNIRNILKKTYADQLGDVLRRAQIKNKKQVK